LSFKVIKIGTIRQPAYGLILATYNDCLKNTLFLDIHLCDLETRVRGNSRSIEMTPFDRSHITSY